MLMISFARKKGLLESKWNLGLIILCPGKQNRNYKLKKNTLLCVLFSFFIFVV